MDFEAAAAGVARGGSVPGGPAPAKGDEPHRYVFAVHALDCPHLDVEPDATPAVVGYTMNPHTLARGLLIPVFGH